jgi:hypothetical protein
MQRWLKVLWDSFVEARREAARARINGRHI